MEIKRTCSTCRGTGEQIVEVDWRPFSEGELQELEDELRAWAFRDADMPGLTVAYSQRLMATVRLWQERAKAEEAPQP